MAIITKRDIVVEIENMVAAKTAHDEFMGIMDELDELENDRKSIDWSEYDQFDAAYISDCYEQREAYLLHRADELLALL